MTKLSLELLCKVRLDKPLTDRTLILDLDETLVRTFDNCSFVAKLGVYQNLEMIRFLHMNEHIAYTISNDDNTYNWGLLRPHLHEFLTFIHNYFSHIIVWSAGCFKYVAQICQIIFEQNDFPVPTTIWCRDNCAGSKDGRFYTKPIQSLITYMNNDGYQLKPTHTLILDDKPYSFEENEQNGVQVPPWIPGGEAENLTINIIKDRSEDSLIQFCKWLYSPEVMNCQDVRELKKNKIFTRPVQKMPKKLKPVKTDQ
jgi:TFIIF-interacting CTD phosphatase-like protein